MKGGLKEWCGLKVKRDMIEGEERRLEKVGFGINEMIGMRGFK